MKTQDQQRFAISHVKHTISYNQQHKRNAVYVLTRPPTTYRQIYGGIYVNSQQFLKQFTHQSSE